MNRRDLLKAGLGVAAGGVLVAPASGSSSACASSGPSISSSSQSRPELRNVPFVFRRNEVDDHVLIGSTKNREALLAIARNFSSWSISLSHPIHPYQEPGFDDVSDYWELLIHTPLDLLKSPESLQFATIAIPAGNDWVYLGQSSRWLFVRNPANGHFFLSGVLNAPEEKAR